MFRAIAILLLVAHVGAVAAPALVEASPPERAPMSHCAPQVGHADAVVAPTPAGCDACEMLHCLGLVRCVHAGVGIVSLSPIELTPTGELSSTFERSNGWVNLLQRPLPPPPKA